MTRCRRQILTVLLPKESGSLTTWHPNRYVLRVEPLSWPVATLCARVWFKLPDPISPECFYSQVQLEGYRPARGRLPQNLQRTAIEQVRALSRTIKLPLFIAPQVTIQAWLRRHILKHPQMREEFYSQSLTLKYHNQSHFVLDYIFRLYFIYHFVFN